jgi:hypothetical protein
MSGPPSERLAELLKVFVGRSDRYAAQQENGEYSAVKRELADSALLAHCRGQVTIAAYTNNDLGNTPVAVLDIDSKSDQAKEVARFVQGWLEHFQIPSHIEASGGKGYHLWVLFRCFLPAAKAQRLLSLALAEWEADHGKPQFGVEVFPKQAGATTFDSPGSAIKLPWGRHRVTGWRCVFLNSHMRPLEDWGLAAIEASMRITELELDAVLAEFPEPAAARETAGTPRTTAYGLPCFAKMMEGVPEGFRHVASFRLAVQLYRQGLSESRAVAMLLDWNKECAPPLEDRVILRNVKDAFTGKYKLGCADIEAAGFCDEKCPIRTRRLLERDEKVKARADEVVDSLVKITSHPPTYRATILGRTIPLTVDQLFQKNLFRKTVMAEADFIPHIGLKQTEWEQLVNVWLQNKAIEEAPPDAADEVELLGLIYDWLNESPKGEVPEDIKAGRPLLRDNGFYFRVKDVVSFLRSKHHLTVKQSQLWPVIKAGQGTSEVVKLRGTVFRLWRLPLEKEEEGDNGDEIVF